MDSLVCPIEYRADDSRLSPGRIFGTLLSYETKAKDRSEVFGRGALSWPADGVVLNLSHDRKQPVTRFTPEQRDAAVVVDVALPDTSRGRDAISMIRDGVFRGLSVEFRALKQEHAGGVRRILSAQLLGAALVDDAAYGNRLEVRRDQGDTRPVLGTLWL